MKNGITSYGAYLPRARLTRKAIADANHWANPALAGMAKGCRTVCGPDEDSLTMGVEAARRCLAGTNGPPAQMRFASTTAPFADRANAVLMCEALGLPSSTRCSDASGFLGAGMVALIDALNQEAPSLIVASDRRLAKPASAAEMALGHGACAVATGSERPIAECLATYTSAEDFIDHYRAVDADTDYGLEERWIRDEGQMKLIPSAVSALLEKASLGSDAIDRLVLAGMSAATARSIAPAIGIDASRLVDVLADQCGNLGTAHAFAMLHLALDTAKAGERILVVNFAQGVQAVLLQATDALSEHQAACQFQDHLDAGVEDQNYVRFLAFCDQIDIDWGMRSERDNRTSLSAFNRQRRSVTGFVGGKCGKCGTSQFPKGTACVNPACRAFGSLEDEPFRDKVGQIRSFTEDWLAISTAPPLRYGNVTFDDGGVIMMEFTDFAPDQLRVGEQVRFVFRIKDKDRSRGFRRYFWKAAPAHAAEADNHG